MSEKKITVEWFHRFIVARNRAAVQGDEAFTFDGHDFLVKYADYLIEYISGLGPEFEVDKTLISLN